MKNFLKYLISGNIGEVVAVFLGSILGIPEILSSVQLLWVNLITDGLPAIALGFNPPDAGLMKSKPRSKNASIIESWTLIRCLVVGAYVGLATIGIYLHYFISLQTGDRHQVVSLSHLTSWTKCSEAKAVDQVMPSCDYFTTTAVKASTLSLTTLVVLEMISAINSISNSQSLFQMPPWKNLWLLAAIGASLFIHLSIVYVPFLNSILGTTSLNSTEWRWILAYSLPLLVIEEVLKFMTREKVSHPKQKTE